MANSYGRTDKTINNRNSELIVRTYQVCCETTNKQSSNNAVWKRITHINNTNDKEMAITNRDSLCFFQFQQVLATADGPTRRSASRPSYL